MARRGEARAPRTAVVRETRSPREDPFVVAGVADYTITTIDLSRVHPALAAVLGVDPARVRASG
ncbi:hypothetical protein [Actinoallomurus sp. CA-142502]|uniref:hypothetical protein n=1 Tax=Actinoallomurus sp. CA-142502 TaxID=3239885 RepID=UPI003D9436EE